MSEEGEEIALWALSLQGTKSWPPELQALHTYWSETDWPDFFEQFQGHDTVYWANGVLEAYQSYKALELADQLEQALHKDMQSGARKEALSYVRSVLDEISSLTESNRGITSIGASVEDNMNAIFKLGGGNQFARLKTGIPGLDEACRPLQPGLYCLFGRPKSGKSWTLQEILYHMAVVQGEPCILVDPENGIDDVRLRMACIHARLSYAEIQRVQLKQADGEELTNKEQELLVDTLNAANDLGANYNIVFMGKEQFDPETGGIPAEKIFSTAEERGIKILFIDQIHKVHSEGAAGRAQTEATRMRKTIEFIDAQPGYLIWCSTQQNRKNDTGPTKMPVVDGGTVFGSDALSHNARLLAHVHKFDLSEEYDYAALQMLTIVLARAGRFNDDHIFIQNTFCEVREYLPVLEGMTLAHESMQEIKAKLAEADQRAKHRRSARAEGRADHRVDEVLPTPAIKPRVSPSMRFLLTTGDPNEND